MEEKHSHSKVLIKLPLSLNPTKLKSKADISLKMKYCTQGLKKLKKKVFKSCKMGFIFNILIEKVALFF